MTKYAGLEHWEERYARDPEPFDWFNKYPAFKPIFLSAGLKESSAILMLGCGTSAMSESLWEDGYKKITNIDFSPACISLMEQRCGHKEGMQFLVSNVLDLRELEGQSYDFIIDKGTLDCVLCGEKSFENINTALIAITRLLRPGGVYIMISYGTPMFRLNHLQRAQFGWTVELQTVEKPALNPSNDLQERSNVHYVYVCRKEVPENAGAVSSGDPEG